MNSKTTKSDIARQYASKYIELALKHKRQYSKRYISNVMFEENPDIFKDAEEARYFIRVVVGGAGVCTHDKREDNKKLAEQFALVPEALREVENTEPFDVPVAYNKTLWIADIHSLFYCRKSLEIAIDYGLKTGCNSAIILGDFMDFYGDSKFSKDPRLSISFFEQEQELGQELLRLLQDNFGYVVCKFGNHDVRRENNIFRIAQQKPELADYAKLTDFLFFDGCTVNFVEDYRHIKYGKLNGIHGHEILGGGGIHIAYNRLNKAFDNIISAHSHRGQSNIKKDINGQLFGSWAIGCLCQLNPRYWPKNDWANGFAVTERDKSGEFGVDNKVIYGGKIFSV